MERGLRVIETHLDKRKSRRYKARLVLRAKFAGLKDTLRGETRNISSSGAFFFVPRTESIAIGERVILDILVPETYAFSGEVVSSRMFRIRATGNVVRLLHDAEMDLTHVAMSFSRHRLVRDEDAAGERELLTDYAPASSSPEIESDTALDAVLSLTVDAGGSTTP